MKFIKNNLANGLTLGNLFFGVIGILHLVKGDFQVTFFCLLASLILDFFDGFTARALKSDSQIGLQLDSLADVVSFGVMPGIAMYQMLSEASVGFPHLPYGISWGILGIFISVASGLRLAIFNLDTEQRYYFKGLNTPTNTLLIFGLYYVIAETQKSDGFSTSYFAEINPWLLIGLSFVSIFLMLSPIKMISMKFKSKKWQDNIPKIVLVIGGLVLLIVLGKLSIPFLVLWYLLVSILFQKQL